MSGQVALYEVTGQAGGPDIFSGFLRAEPGIGIDLPVGMGAVAFDHGRKVQHQGIGRLEIMTAVEVDRNDFQAHFLLYLPDHRVLGILALIDITGDQNVSGSGILFDQQDPGPVLIGHDHADGCIEHRESVIGACIAIGDLSLSFQKSGAQFCSALHTVFHFQHSVSSVLSGPQAPSMSGAAAEK